MAASGCTGRHGHRDKTLILIAYRYGLRVSELVALRWESIDLQTGLIHNNRLKNGVPPTHPLHGVEIRALRRVRRRRVNLENIDEEDVISIGVLLPVEGSDSEKDGERSAKFYHLPTTDVHIPPYVTVFEQIQNSLAIPNVDRLGAKIRRLALQTRLIPFRAAIGAEKSRPHIIVDPNDLVPSSVPMSNRC